MKKIILLFAILFAFVSVNAQKKFYIWVPTKETVCRVSQVQVGVGGKVKIIKIGASYSWSKETCTEREYMAKKKIKVDKAFHTIEGRAYYWDGDYFYSVSGNTCSATPLTREQILRL